MEILSSYSKFVNEYLIRRTLSSLDYNTGKIVPSSHDVFKAFKLCPYDDLKVVMIGQDPYPQPKVATGLAFANKKNSSFNGYNTDVLSSSLWVILQRLILDYNMTKEQVIKFDTTLEHWSKQGILLLNSSLTCKEWEPGSHSSIWYPFMCEFLRNLSGVNPGLIYVLFGEQAKQLKPYIRNGHILEYKHPAYYSRLEKPMECDGFKKVNEILKQQYNTKINWYEE